MNSPPGHRGIPQAIYIFRGLHIIMFSYRMQMFLKPLSYRHFATTSGQCRWTYVYQDEEALDLSHHGHPIVVETVHTGRRGRPPIFIDPDFLRWAYAHRSTSGLRDFYMLVDGLSEMPW